MQDWEGLSGPYYPFWEYYGYRNLGPIQVPPRVQIVGMTDRTTGKVWYLSFDATEQNQNRITLTDTISVGQKAQTKIYPPWDGPYMQGVRLGVNNAHVVIDNDSGPADTGDVQAFSLLGNIYQNAQISPVATKNPEIFDHLQYDVLPHVFFGMTDDITGLVYYMGYDPTTQHILFTTKPPVSNIVLTQLQVFPRLSGPTIDTKATNIVIQLGIRNGHVYADIGTNRHILTPTYAFNATTQAGIDTLVAQLGTAYLTPPFGVADIQADHITFTPVTLNIQLDG